MNSVQNIVALRVAAIISTQAVELAPESEHVKKAPIIWCAFELGETCHQCGKCQKGRRYKDKKGNWRTAMDLQDFQLLISLKEGSVLAYGYGTNNIITTDDDVEYGDYGNSLHYNDEVWDCHHKF